MDRIHVYCDTPSARIYRLIPIWKGGFKVWNRRNPSKYRNHAKIDVYACNVCGTRHTACTGTIGTYQRAVAHATHLTETIVTIETGLGPLATRQICGLHLEI